MSNWLRITNLQKQRQNFCGQACHLQNKIRGIITKNKKMKFIEGGTVWNESCWKWFNLLFHFFYLNAGEFTTERQIFISCESSLNIVPIRITCRTPADLSLRDSAEIEQLNGTKLILTLYLDAFSDIKSERRRYTSQKGAVSK